MPNAQERCLRTDQRSCYGGQCNGKTTYQRLIERVEPGQPVRKLWECTVCAKRDAAPPGMK